MKRFTLAAILGIALGATFLTPSTANAQISIGGRGWGVYIGPSYPRYPSYPYRYNDPYRYQPNPYRYQPNPYRYQPSYPYRDPYRYQRPQLHWDPHHGWHYDYPAPHRHW